MFRKNLGDFAVLLTAALALAACGGESSEKQAVMWLEKARSLTKSGDYDGAISAVDSLRANCPQAIEQRKEALKVYQDASLKKAQLVIQHTDSMLQVATTRYDSVKTRVEGLKERGEATESQLHEMNILRAKRDSLQAAFDVECSKVRYIKAKMKE